MKHFLELMVGLQLGCAGAGPAAEAQAAPGSQAQPAGAVSGSAAEDLTFLREEEKLARDVYLTLHERWGIQAFANISQAEQRHMDRVGALLASRGLADPITDDSVGVFVNETLAGLYSELIAAGSQSEVAALRVGATIEDLDIRDIQLMLARTSDAELRQTYELLLCGSRNHMRAFSRQLAQRGESYAPQYIGADTYQAILSGEQQRCGQIYGGGMGHGGGGMGQGGRGMHGGGMRGQGGGMHGQGGGMRGQGGGMNGGGMRGQGGGMGGQGPS